MRIIDSFKLISLIVLTIGFGQSSLCQEHDSHHQPADEKHYAMNREHYKNAIGFFSGTTLVSTLLNGKDKDYLFVPTYGLEYARFIKTWLGVGIHNEFELQNYVIVDDEGEELDRAYIYVGSLLVYILPIKHLAIMLGPGQELSTEHRFNVFKIGFEYALYRGDGNGWYIAPEASMDWVSFGYQTISFGLAVGKGF